MVSMIHLPRPALIMREASKNQYDGEGTEIVKTASQKCAEMYDDLCIPERITFETMSYDSDDATIETRDSHCDDSISFKLEGNDDAKIDNYLTATKYHLENNVSFKILGSSTLNCQIVDDDDASNHSMQFSQVLTSPLMESLQAFFPYSKSNDNFWMKYSMARDGCSMHTFLERSRGIKHSVLAIETIDGEVFGAFTAESWNVSWNAFGNGETFLWKLRNQRKSNHPKISSSASDSSFENNLNDIIKMESEIEVYPYSGDNDCIQICHHDKIAIGGGDVAFYATDNSNIDMKSGYGLCIQDDMRYGTTSPCVTFRSPSLSKEHADGSAFEIVNLELWALTPCTNEQDAERLETGLRFMDEHRIN